MQKVQRTYTQEFKPASFGPRKYLHERELSSDLDARKHSSEYEPDW